MKLYIPKLGDVLTLSAPWTFTVIDEYRNSAMIEFFGIPHPPGDRWRHAALGAHTLPAGSKLRVDRIYIRKGSVKFDSVTFFLMGASLPAHVEKTTYRQHDEQGNCKDIPYEYKVPKKPIRFFAPLVDVNTMEVENV